MSRDDALGRPWRPNTAASGYSDGMIGRLFKLFALKRLFDAYRARRRPR